MFIIKKNSWHYNLNDIFVVKRWPTDFCSYWLLTMFSLFRILVLFSLTAGLVTLIAFNFVNTMILVGMMAGIFAALLGITFIFFTLTEKTKTSLIVMKYRTWREKSCSPVEYEE